jgi:hypothetical protein
VADMRSVPEPDGSVGGSSVPGRDPWAGFGTGPTSSGRYPVGGNGRGTGAGDDRAVADLLRRLQDRVDGQESLLDRMADLAQRPDDRVRVSELRDVSRRLRRDSEALLLLCGADPGVHRGASHTVPAVLDDAVALVDEPSRVARQSAPTATLDAAAAVELRHLVAEVIDEAAGGAPGSRVEVGARLDPDGALVVDVLIRRGWSTASGPGGRSSSGQISGVAERLARRSAGGLRLQRASIDNVDGLVATLYCPAHLVTGRPVGDPWPPLSSSVSSPSVSSPSVSPGSLSSPALPSPSLSSGSWSASSLAASSSDPSSVLLAPARSRPAADELFGPLPAAVNTVATPIFEAVASAWFRDDEQAPADDWNSPGDREWRAAAARATRTDAPPTTTSGLPRRSPGDRLVSPSRTAGPVRSTPDERAPERVRDRLATYQRGLRQGRHRAADPAATDPGPVERAPEAWTAEGW